MPRSISEIKAILSERKRSAAIQAQEAQRTSPRTPHHGFDPNQPRVPAGNSDGGQWMNGVQNDPRVLSDVIPDNDWQPYERYAVRGRRSGSGPGGDGPGQAARLAIAEARAIDAQRRVRQVDPGWRSRQPSVYGTTVESEIRKLNDLANEAEARIEEHFRPYRPLIEAYRSANDPPNLFGFTRDRKLDTISVSRINGNLIFGSNSGFPGYTRADENAAFAMRDRLIANYPDVMTTQGNIGERPNDALFHAEATVLMRAAQANGGTLFGRALRVQSDRRMCNSCSDVLPKIGLELGNPTVTFVSPNGMVRTMHNGNWLD